MPAGTVTTKTARQPAASTSAPPIVGPAAAASAPAALHAPIAAARRSGGVSARMTASDAGIIAAAPAPWRPRATSRIPNDGATAATSDMVVNTNAPPASSARRPSRSAKRPPGASSAAKVMA